jgi:nitroreductase
MVGQEQPTKGASARPSEEALHPLLAGRWSPTRFDPAHRVSDHEVELILEAARWAPSAGNSQPWAFIVGTRETDVHARLLAHLAGSSRAWAGDASALIANLAHTYVQDTDWQYSEFSLYDLGQAVAHMTIQAQALGLFARQFRAFDRDSLHGEFAVPDHWQIATLTAIGSASDARVPDSRGATGLPPGRQRRALEDLLWPTD